jgi:hypothetical protein
VSGIEGSRRFGGGEQFGEATGRVGPSTAVEQQKRLAFAVLIDSDLDRSDPVEVQRVCRGGHLSP